MPLPKLNEMTARMPVLFLGHGSPMNAISKNNFTEMLQKLGKNLPLPKAILVISAHWMTTGTWVTHMQQPKTIHDFYGFPPELFRVRYPAPGSPHLAENISSSIAEPSIRLDDVEWGLDHGSWSVLRHLYPKANIPVVQLSLNMNEPAEYHFKLGQKLQTLRDQEVLIVGSGNIVHNLSKIKWESNAEPYDWAVEFDEWCKNNIKERNFLRLIHDLTKSEAGKLSVPTFDHYYPLLYTLGAAHETDELHFDFEGIQNSSISMRCLRFEDNSP